MFTPSSIVAMWLRALFATAIIVGASYLLVLWYRELPRPIVEPRDFEEQNERTEAAQSAEVVTRISRWRPGFDKPTALLAAGIGLGAWASGAGGIIYPRFRRPGPDEPSSKRSNRKTRLRRPDGTELNVEEFGRSEGPTVILTHGWGLDSTEWYYAKESLSKDYRLIVWDLPGTGLSSRAANRDYNIERFAHDLHAVVEWCDADRIVLVGHSIGGMILQSYARLYPGSNGISGMALVHTTYKDPVRTTKHGALYTAIEKPVIIPLLYLTIALSPLVWLMNVLSYLNGSTHRSTDKQSFSGSETRGQLEFTARFVLIQSPGILARGMLGMIKFDESSNLHSIRFPTLVVPGELDPVTLPTASQVLADSIPNSLLILIPNGRHQAQMEMHPQFLGALIGFINKAVEQKTPAKDPNRRPAGDGLRSAS
jgi:pimeloyl-ACP methyl ester carboxylesterase